MANIPINSEVKQIIGTESNWENELSSIQDNLIILTRDTDIWKKGHNLQSFINLPQLFKSTEYQDIYDNNQYFDIYITQDYDEITYLHPTSGKITRAGAISDILELEQNIHDHSYFSQDLIIIGPKQTILDTSITLSIEYISKSLRKNTKSQWILPDKSIVQSNNNQLIYHIPNNSGLIGTTLEFKGKLIDEDFNIISKTITKNIEIISGSTPTGYIMGSTIEKEDNEQPSIVGVGWDTTTHQVGKRYTLTINIINPNEQNQLIYTIQSSNDDVEIQNIVGYENMFFVTYPSWTVDTTVTFTIIVNNIFGEQDTLTITQTVTV